MQAPDTPPVEPGASQDPSEQLPEAETPAADLGAIDEWIDEFITNPTLQVVAVIVVSFVLAKVAQWILLSIVRRWTRRTSIDIDDKAIDLLHGPVFKTVVILGLGSAAYRLDLDPSVQRGTQRVLWTLILVLWSVFALKFTHAVLKSVAAKPDRFRSVEPRTYPLFDNLAKVLIAGLAIYLFISIWNVDPTGWLASAGIVGIAVGFAAKDTLANLITGVFIIADAPFKVGDFINLQDGTRGEVVHIGLRSTRLMTRDDVEITIPNNVLGTSQVVNETGGPTQQHRVRIKVGVAYGSDIDNVRRVLLEVAAANETVLGSPEPRVRFRRFGESSLDFELLCWIPQPVLRGRAVDALNTAVYKRFAAEKIEIPFPQRDVHVKQMPGAG